MRIFLILFILLSGCATNNIEQCIKSEIKDDNKKVEEFKSDTILTHLKTNCR